jgi:hypothetical protein
MKNIDHINIGMPGGILEKKCGLKKNSYIYPNILSNPV